MASKTRTSAIREPLCAILPKTERKIQPFDNFRHQLTKSETMKSISILILLFLTPSLVSCQKKELHKVDENFNEIGILNINPNKPLKIYANPTDNFAIDKITFDKINFGENAGRVEVNSTLKDKLKPYGIGNSTSYSETKDLINSGLAGSSAYLKFRVLSSTPEYYEILLNDSTREIGYIKKDDQIDSNSKYESWTDYLKRAQFIIVYNYELFDQIDGNIIEKAENQYRDKYFKVLNVKGDWCQVVEINWQVIENPEKKYWLKWREKGQLMIKVIEFTIE